MIYGYLRVSSDKQDINSQRLGVDAFAKKQNWTIDSYITDEGVSGGKDPSKRNLGPLLQKLVKDDIVIASEISRLGRDLYMVMDILHICMERGVKIYTVKDRFVLGEDIQSKVLAFAFGLAAEIERQMIRQRTREGLRLRVRMGMLLGRPPMEKYKPIKNIAPERKKELIMLFEHGVPLRRLARDYGIDRQTLALTLISWGVKPQGGILDTYKQTMRRQKERQAFKKVCAYKDEPFCPVNIDRDELLSYIEEDMTIPEIHQRLPQYTYEQVYDTILFDYDYNTLYRAHGQKRLKLSGICRPGEKP